MEGIRYKDSQSHSESRAIRAYCSDWEDRRDTRILQGLRQEHAGSRYTSISSTVFRGDLKRFSRNQLGLFGFLSADSYSIRYCLGLSRYPGSAMVSITSRLPLDVCQ